MVNLRFSLTALPFLALAACGRSDPNGSLDTVEAAAVARTACFDTEAELRAALDDAYVPADTAGLEAELVTLLDDNYLAADTPLLQDADVQGLCFDTEAELTALLDDDYLPADFIPPPVAFAALTGIPADLADGDDNTIYSGTSPIEVTGTDISLDPTGCVNGDALGFGGGTFGCTPPSLQAVGAEAVGAAAANARPFEAVPLLAKVEVASGALAAIGDAVDVVIYDAANPAPRALLIVDAWAVGAALATTPPNWHLRDQLFQITDNVAAPNVGGIARVTLFVNPAFRSIDVADTLSVRVTAVAAGDNATFTVYVLALPL